MQKLKHTPLIEGLSDPVFAWLFLLVQRSMLLGSILVAVSRYDEARVKLERAAMERSYRNAAVVSLCRTPLTKIAQT
jgi:hypothetical protein